MGGFVFVTGLDLVLDFVDSLLFFDRLELVFERVFLCDFVLVIFGGFSSDFLSQFECEDKFLNGFEFGDREHSIINSNSHAFIRPNTQRGGFGNILIGENGSILVFSGEEKSNGIIGHFIFEGFCGLVIETEFETIGVHVFFHGFKIKILIVMNVDFL